jgi:type I restriction enzyme S subunit
LVPLFTEQCNIATFLDHETERIDMLIEKKQRQIELLQEKRTALIGHAVTKGLDPKAKMKDSGVEWLGEIPEYWELVRFKYVLWLQRGHDLPVTEFQEGEYPVCGSNGYIGYHSQYTTKGPGVTVGRSGSVGEVNFVNTDYWAHNTALYVKEFRRAIPRYSFYLLKTLDVKYLSEGTAVGTLNRNYIHDLPIGIPAVAEQDAIAAFLDRETTRIDKLLEKVQGSIEMLGEYRTALISAAVTGKIDVRKEVA